MASPPFNITQSLPGDSDIVSQHPPNARTFRDVVESWLLIDHDTNGNHAKVSLPRSASPTTPAASVDVLYTTTSGRLKIKHPDATEEFVGVPPGNIGWQSIPAVPTGWLLADGSNVSRSTYPDLFTVVGTYYSAGDGSTTFGLPDLRGRSPIGADLSSLRITTATFNNVSVGGFGGEQLSTLVSSNVPGGVTVSVNSLSVAVTVSSVSVSVSGTISGSSTGSTASGSVTGTASGGTVTGTASGTVSGTASVISSDTTVLVGGVSDNYTSVAGTGTFNSPTRKALTSSGSITASFSSGSISGSLSSPATVTGSFSGATVSTGSVSGTFSGSGSGTGSGTGTGTGSGVTTGTATAFSNVQPSFVLYPIIKT